MNRKSPREIFLLGTLRILLALATWAAGLWAAASIYENSADRIGFDFYQFWLGGDVLRVHTATGQTTPVDLYSESAYKTVAEHYRSIATAMHGSGTKHFREAAFVWRELYTASTPFFYSVFSVVLGSDYDQMLQRYRLVAVMSLVVSITAVGGRLGYSIAAIGAAVAIAAYSAPVYSDFFVTNINCPQLAVCLIYLFLRDWARIRSPISAQLRVIAGMLLGMLVAFKPNLLLVPILLGIGDIISGRRRQAAIEAAAQVLGFWAAVAISSWRFGSIACWWNWAFVIQELASQLSMPSEYGNISLTRTLYEWTGHNLFVPLAGMLILLATIAIGLARPEPSKLVGTQAGSSRDIDFRRDITLFGLAATIVFMASGLAWLHYPILLYPFLMLAAGPKFSRHPSARAEIVRYLLAALIIVLLMFPPDKALLDLKATYSSVAWIRCTQAAVILSFGTGLWFIAQHLPRPVWIVPCAKTK